MDEGELAIRRKINANIKTMSELTSRAVEAYQEADWPRCSLLLSEAKSLLDHSERLAKMLPTHYRPKDAQPS